MSSERKVVGTCAGIDAPVIRFEYKNWKGETSTRTVKGVPVPWFGTSPYHSGEQWFWSACDAEKNEVRDFALRDILKFY